MDGDGSIQVNQWRRKNLQYRLVIELKFDIKNLEMLNLIKEDIGGNVVLVKNEKILWIVNKKITIINIIKIFEKYPPLTYRLNIQLEFMKNCLINNDINLYFDRRIKKYLNRDLFYQNIDVSYFNEWLSGFIEAEGCFCLRQNKNNSFIIAQKNEKELMEYIKKHFEIQSKVRCVKDNIWIIETYRKSTFLNIIKHCNEYPLLGQKYLSFSKFKKEIM